MASPIRVLCIHGVNTDDRDPSWHAAWEGAITSSLIKCNPAAAVSVTFLAYDDLFANAGMPPQESIEAFLKLSSSWVLHRIGDLFHPSKGLDQLPGVIRWTAGMVVQWSEDASLRNALTSRLKAQIQQDSPDIICAHSMGSLLSYDAFTQNPDLIAGRAFMVFGSQIGNPALRSTLLGGRLPALPTASHFYHLYNPNDPVLTYKFSLDAPNYQQIETAFDNGGLANHDPVAYMTHPAALLQAWPTLAGGKLSRQFKTLATRIGRATRHAARRALLVGINSYPDPANRLEGCVNDTYRVSEVLQEHGFRAEDIRVVLNERATTDALRERLGWLLEGARADDQRVFFYSGHGAQLPVYGPDGVIDHVDECLVPVDFDWTPEHALTDKDFGARYSQLPYGTSFVTVLDCCHSGGMARAGGARVRGLTPPDDIRHRMEAWDAASQTWQLRNLQTDRDRTMLRLTGPGQARLQRYFAGSQGTIHPLGLAAHLRWMTEKKRRIAERKYCHRGPFIPTLVTACRKNELSYEYRQGTASYGAFTYVFTGLLRAALRRKRGNPSVKRLGEEAASHLRGLGYQQTPTVEGPTAVVARPLPWG